MNSATEPATFPDPGTAATLDDVARLLRSLKSWAGSPSYEVIAGRVNRERLPGETVGRSTVADCFRPGRRRVDQELITAVVRALHADPGYVHQWRQALQVIGRVADASNQVRALGTLPDDPIGFVGRQDPLDRLRAAATAGLVAAVQGMAGSGKTHLALRLGHLLVRDDVVDQVLFVDLRGFHRTQPPASPAAVLDSFLRLLGVPGQLVPAGAEARGALYRERLAGRRVLVMLDNAADAEQIRPLVPAVPGCVVVLTSRRELPAAVRVEVGPFTAEESRRYLTGAVGDVATGDDPRALDRIAGRYGHLPLALALVAGQMRGKREWTLTDHAEWAEDRYQAGRLDSGVQAALDLSYRALSGPGRQMLRVLGLHPGQTFGAGAAAALAGVDREPAGRTVGELAAQHLVRAVGPDRFGLHDLVREFAAERAADEERRADRRAALGRFLGFSLDAAAAGLESGDGLEADLSNLVATARLTADDHDRPGFAGDLSRLLADYLMNHVHTEAAFALHGAALLEAQRDGDRRRQAGALMRIGNIELLNSRYLDAVEHLGAAERLFSECGDTAGGRTAIQNRAIAHLHLGRVGEARADLVRLLGSHLQDDEPLLMHVLSNLGATEFVMGLNDSAIGRFEEGLRLARRLADPWLEVSMLSNIAGAEVETGRLDSAQAHLDEALPRIRDLGNKGFEGSALDVLGNLHLARGEHDQAAAAYRRAAGLLREAGYRYAELSATNGLGDVALATGDADRAIAEYAKAHDGANEPGVDNTEQRARAQAGLGAAHHRRGDRAAAREHYTLARELWTGINDTRAARLTEILESLTPAGDDRP